MRMQGLKRLLSKGADIDPLAISILKDLNTMRREYMPKMGEVVEKLLSTIHQCDERIIDGNDAAIEIQTNGDTTVDYECESRTQFVTLKFNWCPFCGVKLDKHVTM